MAFFSSPRTKRREPKNLNQPPWLLRFYKSVSFSVCEKVFISTLYIDVSAPNGYLFNLLDDVIVSLLNNFKLPYIASFST